MRRVTQEDVDLAKLRNQKGGEPIMVKLGHMMCGKWMFPLVDIEIIDGKQWHRIQEGKLTTRLHHSYPVFMLEEGDEIPSTPAPIVHAARPVDRPKAIKEPKPKAERTITEKTYGSKECICGCGRPTGSTFAPGHDASMKSLLKKVQKGEIALDQVPVLVVDYVRSNEKWNGWFGDVIPS